MFINKFKMEQKLEKIYEAQEKYLDLVKSLEKELQDFQIQNKENLPSSSFVDLEEIIGYEKCEMVSVENSMNYIEKQCKKYGITFSNDNRTFFYTKNTTKQDLFNFFESKKKSGVFYVNIEDYETVQIMEFTRTYPRVRYDIETPKDFIAKQVFLEDLVDILDEYCINTMLKYETNEERENDLER